MLAAAKETNCRDEATMSPVGGNGEFQTNCELRMNCLSDFNHEFQTGLFDISYGRSCKVIHVETQGRLRGNILDSVNDSSEKAP